jgi:hypothetical protein
MSDTTTMPFQPGLVTEAPPAPEVEDDSQGNKRILLIVGALAGLAVLLIAAYFLLFSGGGDKVAANAVVAAPRSSSQPSTAPSTAPKTAALPKISARNFGTDPFKPLLTDAAASTTAAGTTAASTTATAPATTASTTTSTPSTGSTTGSTTAPPATTTAPATSQSYHFRVVSVPAGNKTVNVLVNGKAHNGLKAGQVFAKIFKVRFIGGTVNAFQIGDEVFNVNGVKAVTISS